MDRELARLIDQNAKLVGLVTQLCADVRELSRGYQDGANVLEQLTLIAADVRELVERSRHEVAMPAKRGRRSKRAEVVRLPEPEGEPLFDGGSEAKTVASAAGA